MTASVLIALRVAASPSRAFEAFTEDIGAWWVPDILFMITPRGDGALSFEVHASECGPARRLISTWPDGQVFEVGAVTDWDPPRRLAFSWRHANFGKEFSTHVEVLFEPIGEETRVTVTHTGWTGIPRNHAARHGFPDTVTQTRAGEWWRRSLGAYSERLNAG